MQRRGERAVSLREPRVHLARVRRVEVGDCAPAVVGILPTADELRLLEVAGQPARGGERQPQRRGDLADGPALVARDEREHGEMPWAEARVDVQRGTPPPPESAQDDPQQSAELVQLRIVCHMIKVAIR